MPPFAPAYRLSREEADVFWPKIDTSGVAHGFGTPLLRRRVIGSRAIWESRPERELAALFSAGYDEPVVDASGWYRSLGVVATALNDDDSGLALTALVLCRIPPLPSEGHAHAMALADALMEFDADEPRIPQGQSAGGQWTTGDQAPGSDRNTPVHDDRSYGYPSGGEHSMMSASRTRPSCSGAYYGTRCNA